MYDNLKSPGRNDECWCGSGRKYKKCHLDFDERLQSLYEQGFEVPQRSLLKTPEEIEGIKRSAFPPQYAKGEPPACRLSVAPS